MNTIAAALREGLARLARRIAALLLAIAGTVDGTARQHAPQEAESRYALSVHTQLRFVAFFAAGVTLLGALAWGAGALFSANADQVPQAAAEPGTFKPTPEQLASLVIKPVKDMVFHAAATTDGSIVINDDISTPVYSPYTGRVTRLYAKPGDVVAKGAPLMAVDAAEYVQAQNDLITAASNVNSTRAQLNLAETNEKRQHELYDAKGAALKDWQQSQSDLATAQANYHTAEIALASVRNRLRIFGKSEQEIAALEQGSMAVKGNPEAIVPAPIAGTVIQRQVGSGQFIQAGASSPVYTIGNLSTVWFVANVREEDAPFVHVGDDVALRVLALPGRTFHAKVTYVGAGIDPNTHRLPVRADVENPDGLLKPQMFATVSIATGVGETAPAVPQSAVIYEGSLAHVWVETKKGNLGLRQIRMGRSDGDMVEALSGIRAGERVVVSGAIFIDRAASGS